MGGSVTEVFEAALALSEEDRGRLAESSSTGFSFAVVFYVEDETVHVVALEALRKRPGYSYARLRHR